MAQLSILTFACFAFLLTVCHSAPGNMAMRGDNAVMDALGKAEMAMRSMIESVADDYAANAGDEARSSDENMLETADAILKPLLNMAPVAEGLKELTESEMRSGIPLAFRSLMHSFTHDEPQPKTDEDHEEA